MASEIAAAGLVNWNKMASIYAALRLVGMPEYFAVAFHGLGALCGCFLVWRIWRMSSDVVLRAAVLGSATLLISPYVFIYDQVLLVPALAYLSQRGINKGAMSFVYAVAILSLAGNFYSAAALNLAPIVPLALLGMIWRDHRFTLNDATVHAAFGADSRTPSST